MADTIPIVLETCPDYDVEKIKAFCQEASIHLDLGGSLTNATVLLKPNLISSRAPKLACTEALFVRGVAEWFADQGAMVQIGDSPAFGTAMQVLKKTGIAAALEGLDVRVVEFKTPTSHLLTHGVKVGIAQEALDCDLLVNLPRIKAHSQMHVTMAVKNMFGIVCGIRKAVCHMKNGLSHRKFGDLMLDLTEVAGPSVTFVDGIRVMSGSGPIKGEPLDLGCLCAGSDPVGVDTLLLSLLELDQQDCPIWRAAAARDLTGSRIDLIESKGRQPQDFKGSGFKAPTILNPVPFNPFRFMISSLRRAAASVNG